MKYWDEFHSKWSFGEGECVPPEAWALRYVYVREINRLAAAGGSDVRLIAYDRPGCHSPYLICRVPAELVRNVPEKALCLGVEREAGNRRSTGRNRTRTIPCRPPSTRR
jgi:hypothetical protein